MSNFHERELLQLRENDTVPAMAGERLTGYAVVYNQQSRLITDWAGTYYEVIEPGAFDESLKNGNVSFVYRHSDNSEYGDTASQTLTLTSDEKGIRFDLQLPAYARTLREAVTSGAVKGMSFGFHADQVVWKDGVRHVVKGRLEHISAVTNPPAYPQASVALKKQPNTAQMIVDYLAMKN